MRTPLTKAIDGILMATAAMLALTVAVWTINKMRDHSTTVQPHKPAFKSGDCFVRNGIREAWDKEADGKVLFKGLTRYVIMDASEADRKHGGDKAGFEQDIELFDFNHHKVLCPVAWQHKK